MEYNETWNEICFFMKKSKNATERDFETTVLFLFEKLGWSQFKGEIVSQVSIPIGSSSNVVPDIIIKNERQNVFVIELKKPNTKLSDKHTSQLVSYMRLLKLNCGILIGETLKIYYEIPSDNNPPIQIDEIPFVMDNEAGIRFIEVFRKDTNISDNITKYCENRLVAMQEEEKVKQYIEILCSPEGNNLIYDLLNKKLSLEFSEEAIQSIIDKIFINVTKRDYKKQEKIEAVSVPIMEFSSQTYYKRKPDSEIFSLIRLCELNGVSLSDVITFANKTREHSWVYKWPPSVNTLSKDWCIILNDKKKKEFDVFFIPANSISKDQVKFKSKTVIDILLKNDSTFEDTKSGIKFNQWHVKTIQYETDDLLDSNFRELLTYYTNLTVDEYSIYHKLNYEDWYRQIMISNWPILLHYEFIMYKDNLFGIEFHMEDKNYDKLGKILKEYHNQVINHYLIEYDPKWYKLGRLRIMIPYKDGKEIIAQTMLDFIALTKEPIEDYLNNNKIGKP